MSDAPQAAHLALPIASPGKRLAGALLDNVLFAVLAVTTYSADDSSRLPIAIGWLVIAALYEIGLTATRGQTIGKLMVGTKVVNVGGERLPTWGEAAVRWFVPAVPNVLGVAAVSMFVDAATVLWGVVVYLPILRTLDRRGWHDRAAATVVIDVRPSGRRPE